MTMRNGFHESNMLKSVQSGLLCRRTAPLWVSHRYKMGQQWPVWQCNADNPLQEATDQQQRHFSIVLVPLWSPKTYPNLMPARSCLISSTWLLLTAHRILSLFPTILCRPWRRMCVKITVDEWFVSTDIQINVSIRRFPEKGTTVVGWSVLFVPWLALTLWLIWSVWVDGVHHCLNWVCSWS